MNFEKEFPDVFKKKLCIKLNKIKLTNDASASEKGNEQNFSSVVRITRSRNVKRNVDWVRVLSGEYKGELAQVVLFDLKNNKVDLKLFPRIDYGLVAKKSPSKRRPASSPFDVDFMRFVLFWACKIVSTSL